MGNPLLDISNTVDEAYLSKYGLEANNAILAEDKHLPIYSEIMEKGGSELIAGGATQNSIRIAQWMLSADESQTAFIGSVGKDNYSEILSANMSSAHVNAAYHVDADTPTGTCACLITGNNRSLVANISAANNYKIEHLETPEVWALVESAKYFYISGFFLTVSPPSIMKVAEHAAAADKTFIMNLAAPFICQFFKDPLMACAPYWDIIVGNETEAETLATTLEWGTKDLKEIAGKILALPKTNDKKPRTVIITHGAEPAIVATAEGVTEYPVALLAKEEIVDTNGAGDAWVGGFLSQLVQGKDMAACVAAGQYCACEIIKRSGATVPEGRPTKEF